MAEPLANKIIRKVKQLDEFYHHLMLVVAPSGAGKTTALQDMRNRPILSSDDIRCMIFW